MVTPCRSSLTKWRPLPMDVKGPLCWASISSQLILDCDVLQYCIRSALKMVADRCWMHTFQMLCMSLHQLASVSLAVLCLCCLEGLDTSSLPPWPLAAVAGSAQTCQPQQILLENKRCLECCCTVRESITGQHDLSQSVVINRDNCFAHIPCSAQSINSYECLYC